MKYLPLLSAFFLFLLKVQAQTPPSPEKIYGPLFEDIQMGRIFSNSKTFLDCTPKKDPEEIVSEYKKILKSKDTAFSLEKFVSENFDTARIPQLNYVAREKDMIMQIKNSWGVLTRSPDHPVEGSSLLSLPASYIVPGGRFRELHYWDSYFILLGLKESGQVEMMENMIRNFAYLINTYGHIPYGSRSYYLSRSQPPFFSLMIELLAEIKGDVVYQTYLPVLEKEYEFWMDGSEKIKPGEAYRRVVKLKDGTVLNRYWDDLSTPRPEYYREDVETADKLIEKKLTTSPIKNKSQQRKAEAEWRELLYRNLRAGSESGMENSSRWLADGQNPETIETINYVAVDLNALLYHLEQVLKLAYTKVSTSDPGEAAKNMAKAGDYERHSQERKKAMETYCWNESKGIYSDFNWVKEKISDQQTMASTYPLYFQIAERGRANRVQNNLVKSLLQKGGWMTSSSKSGAAWDAPYGWAPFQWMGVLGLEKYGFYDEAKEAATRWIHLNTEVFQQTGQLLQKYNVENQDDNSTEESQDGYAWTNGVLLRLISLYKP